MRPAGRTTEKGQLPLAMVVLKSGVTRGNDEIVADLIERVRDTIGPVAAFRHAVIVDRLPKTRSGKTVRPTLRDVADDREWSVPATIDDPAILTEIRDRLRGIGYGGG